MDEKYKRDRIFLICQIAVAVLGAAVIIVKGNLRGMEIAPITLDFSQMRGERSKSIHTFNKP